MHGIGLSMEIPVGYLRRWTSWTELDFVLAHKVLDDTKYASHYARRAAGRELILDNSMHELGYPLPVKMLLQAARKIDADYTIAPDQLKQPERNREWFDQTYEMFMPLQRKVAVVMCGRDSRERVHFLEYVRNADMLCLPFREERLAWFREHEVQIRSRWTRIHLLGVNEIEELRQFAQIALEAPEMTWTVDTAKPIKWGVALREMKTLDSPRGASLSSKDLLDLQYIRPSALHVCDNNIAFLRSICQGEKVRIDQDSNSGFDRGETTI